MTIRDNLQSIRRELPERVKMVAVSKTKSIDQIIEAYETGQRMFGENKVQELLGKWQELPKDIQWHFIGHLQTNKVKQVVPVVSLIHGVDSFKLLAAINKEAEKCSRIVPVLLEFHIAEEENKFGLTLETAEYILSMPETETLKNVSINGVMGMATYTNDIEVVRTEFEHLSQIFYLLKKKYFPNAGHFSEISMGMSDDYPIAILAGSTIVRIGSKIFGTR